LLREAETGAEVEGQLLYDLSAEEMRLIDGVWRPYLVLAERELEMRGGSPDVLPDSRGWEWLWKLQESRMDPAAADWRFFGLSYRSHLQGALVISTTPRPCRASAHRGRSAVGIEFVASAPWNLGGLMGALRRRKFLELIGRALLRVAISYSRAARCEGRLYLYSVPRAESYYRDVCGMIEMAQETHGADILRPGLAHLNFDASNNQ